MSNKGYIYKDGKAFEIKNDSYTPQYGPKIYGSEQDALSYGRMEDSMKNMQRPPSALYDPDWKKEFKKKEEKKEDTGWCFISTACFKSLGFDDNSIELQKLRSYRDDYLSKIPTGKNRINEYYLLAPKIVNNIDSSINSSEIYSFIYEKMIKPSIDFIDSKELEKTFSLFEEGFKVIKQNYL